MRFWDSSAVVPLLLDQDASTSVRDAFEADPEVVAWWGTRVECASAIARLEREGIVEPRDAEDARARLDALARTWHEVQPAEPVRRAAERMLRLHRLRALDAFQAGAAMVLAENDPTTLGVVCLDARLSEALRREGFVVEVPG
jgi:uncharacterized protein with PIN domain